MTLTIGQKLYEPRDRGHGYVEHVVQSIGRKWITLDFNARCTIDTLMLDCGGYSPRQLYTSIEAHQSAARLGAAWRDLQRDVQYAERPEGITVEKINDIRRQLGLEVLGED